MHLSEKERTEEQLLEKKKKKGFFWQMGASSRHDKAV